METIDKTFKALKRKPFEELVVEFDIAWKQEAWQYGNKYVSPDNNSWLDYIVCLIDSYYWDPIVFLKKYYNLEDIKINEYHMEQLIDACKRCNIERG